MRKNDQLIRERCDSVQDPGINFGKGLGLPTNIGSITIFTAICNGECIIWK